MLPMKLLSLRFNTFCRDIIPHNNKKAPVQTNTPVPIHSVKETYFTTSHICPRNHGDGPHGFLLCLYRSDRISKLRDHLFDPLIADLPVCFDHGHIPAAVYFCIHTFQ